MKVAVVCPYALDRPGGVQGQAIQLVEWLGDAGHEAWLVGPGRSGGPAGTVYVGGTVALRANRSAVPVALNPMVLRRTAGAVAGADVVHIHEPLVPAVSLGALLYADPPKVVTFHADPGRGVQAAYRLGAPLLRGAIARAAVVTAVSEVAAAGAALLGVEAVIVPNGLDAAVFRPAVERRPGTVAFLGRDDPRKGLDVVLQAWPEVRAAVPGARLVVLGARRAPMAGVEFVGPVGDGAKREGLAGAEILVAPNLGGESFGMVLAEGMAAGCAVVASDLPGFSAVLGDAGVLVAPGDPGALAAVLIGLLEDRAEVARLSALAGRRVRRFDRTTVLAEYLKAYTSAADE